MRKPNPTYMYAYFCQDVGGDWLRRWHQNRQLIARDRAREMRIGYVVSPVVRYKLETAAKKLTKGDE